MFFVHKTWSNTINGFKVFNVKYFIGIVLGDELYAFWKNDEICETRGKVQIM